MARAVSFFVPSLRLERRKPGKEAAMRSFVFPLLVASALVLISASDAI